MGKSKSKTRQRSKETLEPNPVYAPYINAGAAELRPAFEKARGNVESLMPRIERGLDYYDDVLSGEYLDGNPYLDAVIGDTNQSIADTVASQFSGAGRYGSGYHTRTLADRIAANENALRFTDYARERDFQNDAPRNIGGMATLSAALPQMPSQAYAEALQGLLGRYITGNSEGTSTTVQKQGAGGLLAGVLGAGLSGWASGGFGGI